MEYKRFNDFVGKSGQDMKVNPMDYAINYFTYPKNAAILNKIAYIIPNKCSQKCNGFYQIN